MASELKVDKFTGVTTAGSIDVTGEGNSTTTNLQQGLAKAWTNTQQASSYSTRDSFNLASITDGGTGKTGLTFTNAFANANHATTALASNLNNLAAHDNDTAVPTTTTIQLASCNATDSLEDATFLFSSTHGDLA